MIADVQTLLDQYWTWLRDRTDLHAIGDVVQITTPYLDRHNDYLQIYATRTRDGFVLSDGGYIVEDLEQSGCKIESATRQAMFQTTLNGFGVETNGNALEVRATVDDFALRKHNLVQAMLAVNDLFYLASSTIVNLFSEDVRDWLDAAEIRYTPSVTFVGTSGFNHRFDFVIPRSGEHPERVLRAINSPNRNTAQAVVFSRLDTRKVRDPDSCAYALLNDTDSGIPDNVTEALRGLDVRPVPWSHREEVREELAA